MANMIWKHDERIVVYPPYIDSTRTHAEGRRIPKEHAVVRPHVLELKDACDRTLGLTCEIEDKCYSRDIWQRGRLRIEWKNADGTFVKEELSTRGAVLKALAKAIAKSEHRMKNLGAPDASLLTAEQVFEKYLADVAAQGPAAPGQGKKALEAKAAAGKAGSSKKKGKKGRK